MPSAPPGRSDELPVPMFISDTMEPTEHVDGKFYTSKSKFRSITKARNCTEMGNDPARFRVNPKPKPDRAAIKDAVQRAESMVLNGIPLSAAK